MVHNIVDKFEKELDERAFKDLVTTLLLKGYKNIEKVLGDFKRAYKKRNRIVIEFEEGDLVISKKEVLLNLKGDLDYERIKKIVKRELVYDG